MQRVLFLLLLVAGTLSAMSQNVLNVHSKTGIVVSYAFSEKPVVTYNGDILVIKTEKISVEYPLSNLEKVTFNDSESDVESIFASGEMEDRTIRIFDTNGQCKRVIELGEDDDSNPVLLLKDLSQGIYVIKQGSVSYKIIKQ